MYYEKYNNEIRELKMYNFTPNRANGNKMAYIVQIAGNKW